MAFAIDLDRGVTKRTHPSGVVVCMYKNNPGVYLDTSGREVSEKVAREAGFPVDQYAKEKERREKVAAALAEINEEYGNIPVDQVVMRVGSYSVVHAGNGEFVLHDDDGTSLTTKPMDKLAAIKLAKKMAANDTGEEDKEDGAQA